MATSRIIVFATSIAVVTACGAPQRWRPVSTLKLGEIVRPVHGYKTMNGAYQDCVGKAQLRRSASDASAESDDAAEAQRQRYQACVDRRAGNAAAQQSCAVLQPNEGMRNNDLAFRCAGEPELRVVPASTVRVLDVSPPSAAGLGQAVAIGAGVLLLFITINLARCPPLSECD